MIHLYVSIYEHNGTVKRLFITFFCDSVLKKKQGPLLVKDKLALKTC